MGSIFVLIKAADHFTDSAEELGLYLGLPPFLVGVTIVAIGTSLPEVVSSIVAVTTNASEFVVANVIGANITNIFLILGLAAIIGKKLTVAYNFTHVDLPVLVGSAFVLAITIYDGTFTLAESFICLGCLLLYVLYMVATQRASNKKARALQRELTREMKEEKRAVDYRDIFIMMGSAVFIYIGARFTVESVITLSNMLDVGKELIAVSVVALGTTLPELTVSIRAAMRHQPEIAIGNVLGSNIFNVFGVMGIAGLFGTITIPHSILIFGLPVMIIATLLYFFITQDKEITQWEGGVLVIFYLLFIAKLFNIF